MERNFETVMIEQCAPTLAGLKPANLFRHETRDREQLLRQIAGWNAQLNGKGVQIRIIKECTGCNRYLIYVYRPAKLADTLANPETRAFLASEGYAVPEEIGAAECEALLVQLAGRLDCESEFPHEIGVFLGYPLEDVVGFITNRGRNFTCCGCWKAYGDAAAARQLFDRLNKCTAVYLRLFHSGTPIFRLAVAA